MFDRPTTFKEILFTPVMLLYPRTLYNLACAYVKWGDMDTASKGERYETALRYLEQAMIDPEAQTRALKDSDFNGLKNDPSYRPRFEALFNR